MSFDQRKRTLSFHSILQSKRHRTLYTCSFIFIEKTIEKNNKAIVSVANPATFNGLYSFLVYRNYWFALFTTLPYLPAYHIY